jgi:hypothetical protein
MLFQGIVMPDKKDALMIPAVENNSSRLVEVITYIREDQALALEMIHIAEQQRGGAGSDQAVLFQEALDLLINTRLRVIRLGKKETKEAKDALALPEAEEE